MNSIANGCRFLEKFYIIIGLILKVMKILQRQISLFTEDQLISSQEDSHANHTQAQASDLGKRTSGISGRICSEQFQRLNQPTLWARMFVDLLIGMGEWSSKKCALTWKVKGTKYNRYFCQLVPSVRHIEEIEYGLLPTPVAMDYMINQRELINGKIPSSNSGTAPLKDWASNGLLPTPIAGDWKGQRRSDGTASMLSGKASLGLLPTPRVKGHGNSHQRIQDGKIDDLTTMMRFRMLPTPNAMEGEKITGLENQDSMTKIVREITGKTSQLNPRFVGEMMGFPPNWTELPFRSGEMNQ